MPGSTTGAGADVFVLGNSTTVFYDAAGTGDFALIVDFQAGSDKIQLNGSNMMAYGFGISGTETQIFYNGDLIGRVLNITPTNLLNSGSIVFA